MNSSNAKDYLPLVQALSEGKVIQYKYQKSDKSYAWIDLESAVDFCMPAEFYRIKPEPKEIWVNERKPAGKVVFDSDANPHVIALWRAVRGGWVPPTEVSEDEYKSAKDEKAVDALTAFIGFACSFAAKWFGGYARGKDSKGNARNYAAEGSRGCLKKAAGLAGADLISCSYDDLRIPPNSIIYCDPPYLGTQGYVTGSFDHEKFWLWCDDMVNMGNKVFVSEYQAPDGWISVWERKVVSSLDKNRGGKVAIERLFIKDARNDQR